MDFTEVWDESCRDDPQSTECERAVHDYIHDVTRDGVRTRVESESVIVGASDGDTQISMRFPIEVDSVRGEAFVGHEGTAMVEHDGDRYLIREGVPVESEMIERDLPDVDQIRRDARRERRDRRREYRRQVL